jgi:hypothetical protein
MDFHPEPVNDIDQQPAQNSIDASHHSDKPVPLGLPVWVWE